MSSTTSSGLHSLATLIKRLEAAASRFEDIAELPLILDPSAAARRSTVIPAETGYGSPSSPSLPPPPPPPPPPAAPTITASAAVSRSTETPKSVTAFQEDVIDGKLKPFLEFTQSFAGPNVIEVVTLVQKQYDILFAFLKIVAACQAPDQKTLESLVSPFADSIEAISRAKEAYRRDRDWFSHLTLLSEGAPVIGWVVSPIPIQSIVDIKDSVVYYGNKLKQASKDKDPKHAQWVNSYVATFDAMQSYVKEYHTAGLVWNPRGVTVEQYKASGTTSAPPATSPGPPPPPPPPPTAPNASTAPPAGGAAAVFAQLNRGEEVTKGLRKVDKSEMTHKNPALRASSVVPATIASTSPASKKPTKPSKPQALSGKKPPKFLLDGNKWLIEFQETETITVNNVEINQSVNIFGCKGTTIIINGKVNAINLINSSKTSILVQSVVSAVSVTASPSFQIQVTGSAPMIQLDSTDYGQIYLSKDSLNAEITTAKCSAININLPVGQEEGVFDEQPVPEMFKTVVQNGKLVTTMVEHTG